METTIKENKDESNKVSTWFSFLNVIPYALVPLVWISADIGFSSLTNELTSSIAKAVVVTTAKDLISAAVFVMVVLMKGKWQNMKKILMSRAGVYVLIAGLFGGPIGYSLFNSAFFYAGASYGHIFTVLEPVILVVSGVLLFKRKYNIRLWIGVVMTTLAIMALVFGSAFKSKDATHIIVGAVLGIAGAISWALETVLFDMAFSKVEKTSDVLELLTIKMVGSVIFSFAIMMPLTSQIASGSGSFSYKAFGNIFTDSNNLSRFFIAGTLIMIGRYMYFFAIDKNGGTVVSVIFNLTIVLTPLFLVLWFLMSGNWLETHTTRTWIVMGATAPFIITGITLVALNKPEIIRDKNIKPKDKKINKEKK